jgi:hypothetical protein
MDFVYPDLDWYLVNSERKNAAPRCPFANVHKCHRYYSSLFVLGEANIMTRMDDDEIKELDGFWDKTRLLPIVLEHDTGIESWGGRKSSYRNFCPEISYDAFRLFATYLHRYSDEIDYGLAHERLAKDSYPKDWRWDWENIEPLHYLKCPVYSQLISNPIQNETIDVKDSSTEELFELKPGWGGIHLNIKSLLTRLAKWWLSKYGR